MKLDNFSPDHQEFERKKRFTKKHLFIFSFIFLLIFIVATFFYKTSNILTIAGSSEEVGIYKNFSVEKEKNRVDVLILGIRGAGDENGGLLADTILLASFDKDTEQTSLFSIPRDLFVEIPDYPQPERINFVYALGEQRKWGGGGLILMKEVVQYVTGVYIDHAIVVNFEGFEKLVDIMGGVEIYRDTPFYESEQWRGEGNPNSKFWYKATRDENEEELDDASSDNIRIDDIKEDTLEAGEEYWVFHVPAGYSVLGGEDTLYYVRSRYTSNDFNRIKRQQQVIESLKSKSLSLGVIGNPIKVFEIIDVLGNNVRTDMALGDIREIVSLADKYGTMPIKGTLLEASEEGLLKDTFVDGKYVLVPKSGDLDSIRNFVKNIFSQ